MRPEGNPNSGLGAKLGINGLVNAMFAVQGDMLCSGPDTHWSLCFIKSLNVHRKSRDDHCAVARAGLRTALLAEAGITIGVRCDW